MKKIITGLILIFCNLIFSQNIQKTFNRFVKDLEIGKNKSLVRRGEKILFFFEENNYETDSLLIEIRLYTALALSNLGNANRSLELNLNSLKLIENKWGTNNYYYSTVLKNTSYNYSELCEFTKALQFDLEALRIRSVTIEKNHPDYMLSLRNVAQDYLNLGNLNLALEYNLEALKLIEQSSEKLNSDFADALNNTASVYWEIGEIKKSLELNLRALDIYDQTIGKENLYYANCLNNIATNYHDLGEFPKSLNYYQESMNIVLKVLGKNCAEYALALNNIATYYNEIGDDKKALELYLQALSIYKKVVGKYHADYAMSVGNIATSYSALGDYKNALKYNLIALEIREKLVDKDHPDYILSLSNIKWNYSELKNYSKAFEYGIQASNGELRNFRNNMFGLTEEMQFLIKEKVELEFSLLASLFLVVQTDISDLNNLWIEINNIISCNHAEFMNRLLNGQDISLVNLFNELKSAQLHLLKMSELPEIERQQYGVNMESEIENISKLKSDLSKRNREFEEINQNLTSLDIKQRLSKNEVFVDLFNFKKYDFINQVQSDSSQYLFFITKSVDTTIDFVCVSDGNKMEQDLFLQYKQEITNSQKNNKLKDSAFYNSFWKPIADKIGDAKTVYVSLGGVYNNINLNTLYNPETGKYLIEEKDIRIVNSARDFVLMKERLSAEAGEKKQFTSTTSALYGFPDFNGYTTFSVDSSDYLASTRDLNAMWIDSLTRGGLKASPLPATKVEVEQIAGTFQKNGWKVNTYTGADASETNIKKETSPRVLHVATHGYFFEDIPIDTIDNRFLGMDRSRVVQDPMLRSGLLFTGANKTLQGEESKGENGLLSAAEASLLDLRETELVVLSACETGKGEVKNSEGVYGLRKAFADAGAQNIIMSLWKVDDKVTQEFMTRFYEIWLNEKTSIREAFNRTQLEIKAKYPQPYYWGAFILVGE